MHQIYDHFGDSGVQKSLENAHSYLRKGGKLVIRDAVSAPPLRVEVKMNEEYFELFSVFMKNSVEPVSVSVEEEVYSMDVSDLVSFLGKAEKLRLNSDLEVVKRGRYSVDDYHRVLTNMRFSHKSVVLYRYSSHLIPDGVDVDCDQLPTTYCMLTYSKEP